MLLTTADGQCIRFQSGEDVRLFKGRDSDGVRGIRLEEGDWVISMAILAPCRGHAGRARRLPEAGRWHAPRAGRRGRRGAPEPSRRPRRRKRGPAELTPERYAELGAREEFVLTVSERGFGKRTSSYEYRISGRGGKGIVAMIVNERNGRLVASFPIEEGDQIMLVTDGGQLIRCPVDDVRHCGPQHPRRDVFDR